MTNNLRSFYNGLSPSFFALFSSILMTSFGLLFFQQRSQDSLSSLNTFTYDASMYLNMTNGFEVPGPHSCRILLPNLAKLLPLGSVESIFMINIISFVIIFYGLIKILEKFTISRSAILFSLAIFFSTYSLAYNFTNPFLTDLPALASMIMFIYSVFKYQFITALIWFVVSLLFRETIIVLIPLFFFIFPIKKCIFAITLSLLSYLLPKIIISGNINCNFNSSIFSLALIDLEILVKTVLSYGPIWFLGCVGLVKLKDYDKHLLKIGLVLLILSFVGSVLSSFKSVTDITRMYILMVPILFLGSALVINNILSQKHSHKYLSLIVIFGFLASIGFFPNILIFGDFNSLSDFAISNYILIISSLTIQLIIVILIIKIFITNFINYDKIKLIKKNT